MFGDELRHLEHTDGRFSVKNLLQIFVGVDISLVRGVLETVLFNILPQLLYDLGAGHGPLADDGGQVRTDLHRLHERRICHTFLLAW